jgi:hypothetical protein
VRLELTIRNNWKVFVPLQIDSIDVLLFSGLFPALLLYRKHKRIFNRAQDFIVNLAAGFGALLPVALSKFDVTEESMGLYAIAYFLAYFSGLLVYNWRQSKHARGKAVRRNW